MPSTSTPTLDPADIKRLGNAFCHAKLLLTATELGLFADLSSNGRSTADEIAARLHLAGRGAGDFLDALTVLGLLDRTAAGYDLADAARRHLVPGGPAFLGGFLDRANQVLYPAWGKLATALRTGRPQTPSAGAGAFAQMLADPVQRERYLGMMDGASGQLAPHLAAAVDWSAVSSVVDVGGARGNLAAALVTAHPHLSATVFDLPAMAPSFADHMRSLRPPTEVRFVGGDFFVDPLPTADVLIIGHVLHNWSPPQRQTLIARAYAALPPGGLLLVYDAMLDDEPADLARLLVSLNMLLVTSDGAEYRAADGEQWLREAGFAVQQRRSLGSSDTLLVARRPTAGS
ncbi:MULTISPECIES: methyltransferase [unclassified Solwaraspora]|uniref:methyltransferase n=1 Tax=unclassified Solwaraspora TaxID=2627926 RepID=UPI00259BAD0D|nr:methyltransferase [Solwaraspora sp. WMMA2056]WJK38254.1 methyltransferase [Solwaraspora sp. WMMA2056]